MLPSAHQSAQPKRQFDQFSSFCTAHGRKSLYFIMGNPSPKIGPSDEAIWTPSNTIPWAHPSPQPKQHLDRFSCFCRDNHRASLHFTMGHPFANSKLPLPMGIWAPWFPGPTRVLNPNSILIGSAVFAGLTTVTDKPIDRQTMFTVSNNRLHLRM